MEEQKQNNNLEILARILDMNAKLEKLSNELNLSLEHLKKEANEKAN